MYDTYLRLDIRVWDSNRAVIHAARSKIADAARTDPTKRDARKHFYREMLRHHADAQELVTHFAL